MESTTTHKRRSRMRRESSGKRVELTARDIEILKLLQRYRYLRSTFLFAFIGSKNETRFKERLGSLYHDGRYVNRPAEQWQYAGSRYAPAVYELDRAGESVLANLGHPKRTHGGTDGKRQFAHSLMISETLASIELGARTAGNARAITADEIAAAAPKAGEPGNPLVLPASISHTFPRSGKMETAVFDLVPDGLFGLAYTERDASKSYRFFALEVERENRVAASSLKPASFLKKVLAYRDIATRETFRTQLGIPNLAVLVVTESAARIETMKKTIFEVTGGKGSPLFLFRPFAQLGNPFAAAAPSLDLFSGPWSRAGHPDFYINRP
jgi:hypothetical protein